MRPEPATAPPSSLGDPAWQEVSRQALALAAALRTLAATQDPSALSACVASANMVDEIVRMAESRGKVPLSERWTPAPTPQQLQDFGRLLRDKRNQARFSRVQLARRAKISEVSRPAQGDRVQTGQCDRGVWP